MIKNSTRILIGLAGFLAGTALLIGAIIGVHSIHKNDLANSQTSNFIANTSLDITGE